MFKIIAGGIRRRDVIRYFAVSAQPRRRFSSQRDDTLSPFSFDVVIFSRGRQRLPIASQTTSPRHMFRHKQGNVASPGVLPDVSTRAFRRLRAFAYFPLFRRYFLRDAYC